MRPPESCSGGHLGPHLYRLSGCEREYSPHRGRRDSAHLYRLSGCEGEHNSPHRGGGGATVLHYSPIPSVRVGRTPVVDHSPTAAIRQPGAPGVFAAALPPPVVWPEDVHPPALVDAVVDHAAIHQLHGGTQRGGGGQYEVRRTRGAGRAEYCWCQGITILCGTG